MKKKTDTFAAAGRLFCGAFNFEATRLDSVDRVTALLGWDWRLIFSPFGRRGYLLLARNALPNYGWWNPC